MYSVFLWIAPSFYFVLLKQKAIQRYSVQLQSFISQDVDTKLGETEEAHGRGMYLPACQLRWFY